MPLPQWVLLKTEYLVEESGRENRFGAISSRRTFMHHYNNNLLSLQRSRLLTYESHTQYEFLLKHPVGIFTHKWA